MKKRKLEEETEAIQVEKDLLEEESLILISKEEEMDSKFKLAEKAKLEVSYFLL